MKLLSHCLSLFLITSTSCTVLAADPHPSTLAGPFVATVSGNEFSGTGGLVFRVRKIYYRFTRDGRFCFGLPPDGDFTNFDVNPQGCGKYQIVAGKLHLSSPANPSQEFDFATLPNGIILGRNKYLSIRPSDGLRIEGAFANSSFVNTSTPGTNSGGVGGEHRIVFTKDGHFKQQGFTGLSSASSTGGVATSEQETAGGTYTLHGYQIELTYEDGRKERRGFFRYPNEEDEVLVIDGATYLRQRIKQ